MTVEEVVSRYKKFNLVQNSKWKEQYKSDKWILGVDESGYFFNFYSRDIENSYQINGKIVEKWRESGRENFQSKVNVKYITL